MTPKHIAIVGYGFTGTSAFYPLVDQYPVEEITIFESTGDFVPGYPYRTDECRENNTSIGILCSRHR
ncbi:FAD/NAD(P)-binding protein [Microbulbifer sp. SSSA002]|uniref:FAD/NAD(P)-binding protein n=1 Tax=Microbulbifer sp. SSSA002 TaxID=3243376 RepID=UPI004039E876